MHRFLLVQEVSDTSKAFKCGLMCLSKHAMIPQVQGSSARTIIFWHSFTSSFTARPTVRAGDQTFRVSGGTHTGLQALTTQHPQNVSKKHHSFGLADVSTVSKGSQGRRFKRSVCPLQHTRKRRPELEQSFVGSGHRCMLQNNYLLHGECR
jgi:hypothetical protein